MFTILSKSMWLFLLAAAVLAVGSGLLAQNQPQGQKDVRKDRYGDPLPHGAVARLGTLRFRAPAEIVGLAYAPDGKTVAVSSYAGLFLFDAVSGKRLRLVDPDSARVANNSAVFSLDSKRLALRGRAIVGDPKGKHRFKQVVRVWDLGSDRKPREYDAEHLVWFGWSADNEPLAVCLEKGGLRLLELAAGKSRYFACQGVRTPQLSYNVLCDYAPAGRVLAVVDELQVIHVWDTTSGRERFTYKSKNVRYIRSAALSPDGRILACIIRDQSDAEIVQVWDSATGKDLHTLAGAQNYLATVVFAPNGKTLATAGWRGVQFWDVTTGNELSRSQGPGSEMEKIAFSADGRTLATMERHTAAFHLWDVATGKRKAEPPGHTGRPGGTFSSDGRHLFTAGALDGTIHLWNTSAGNSLMQLHRDQWVRDIALSPDTRLLFSTWTDDNLWISDAASGERKHVIKLEDPDRPETLVAFSYYYPKKNGAGPRYQDTLITGWDTSTYKQLFRRRLTGQNSWIAVSSDARMLATPHHGGSDFERAPGQGPMRLEDLATGALLLTFPVLNGQTWPLAFSPDGRLLASNNSDYSRRKEDDPTSTGANLRLWEIATAIEVLSLPIGGQYRAAFSPDGRLLAMNAPQQAILVFDLAAGCELRRFKDFDAEVISLAFSPDGRRLVSGLADSTLLIWDVNPPAIAKNGKITAAMVAQAWNDLAGSNGARSFRARWTLASSPSTALPLLKERLKPVQPADAQRLRQLLAGLDSEQFTVRNQAQKELQEIGELAAPALRQALKEKASLEKRQRIDNLLGKLRGPITRPELVRAVRAVAVLEQMAAPEARKLLQTLAQGTPEARQTQEAIAALKRLTR